MPGSNVPVSGQPGAGNYGIVGTPGLVDPQFQGQVVGPLKPQPYVFGGQVLGHYRVAAVSGLTTTLAAGVLLYALRWADASRFLLLKRIRVSAAITTAFTAAQPVDVDAISVRGWSASDTGGTPILLPANSQKNRVIMGTSLLGMGGDVRIATATALGAGATKTPDANPFASEAIPGASGGAVGAGGGVDLYKFDVTNQHPIMYAANEGFNLRVVTTQGAVGVVKYYVTVEYAEVASI